MAERNELGSWGETLASDYLRKNGYEILAANVRSRLGEIDLIAARGGTLAFVEVKLRRSDRYGTAAEYVTREKQRRIRLTAEQWLQEHPQKRQPQFDVIEIYAPYGRKTRIPQIRHLEDAFQDD